MENILLLGLAGLVLLAGAYPRLHRRLQLSRAKHPSLAGHSKMARRISRLVPYYEFDAPRFFAVDGALGDIVARRRRGFAALAQTFRTRFAASAAFTESAAQGIADLQFTSRYRVPYPFSRYVREHLKGGSFVRAADGATFTDLDGNRLWDLTGSYGVNLFGYDFYRDCIARGAEEVAALGPVLGHLHPVVAENVQRLRKISGLDEVSFHMSGTEAIMQAVRLARYHTRRRYLVRFNGAYHGWWDDVQPGVGNPVPVEHTFTLRDMDDRTLRVLEGRSDIACVLVNPAQALHTNAAAFADSSLVDSSRRAGFDRAAYAAWLAKLREVCTRRGIVLILDEVFVGFRLAPGGAQEYFGVRADMVTYGKSLGGGLPVGVVCGQPDLMRRFREDRPADICFARGTFNSHPYVMGAMKAFLDRIESPGIRAVYERLDETWDARAAMLNARLEAEKLPLRVANLSTIWSLCYTRPGRYNWMLQYYLRAEGVALAWIGTGRLIFTLDFPEAGFHAVVERIVAAARAMERDGWWWDAPELTDRKIRRAILLEMLERRFSRGTPHPRAAEPVTPAAGAASRAAGR
ncbi:MAG TPA: aminotransferase class III-fold pyridoxal phosphate-dependent enzyme [Usitatibacter sp.]|jgi:glutamate-1-semialdehyde 2,1-aminomutase|nr:aminotransferase class III-fold pyridoxal phosphate-dependent enzyme [Usitatibacter sp.]